MPIYAYRCESCGFGKDVLQKLSDAPLTRCPECGAETFRKQVTAAGFQLKGSGWYVTDFRGGNESKSKASNASDKNGTGDSTGDGNGTGASAEGGKSGSSDAASGGSATTSTAPAATTATTPAAPTSSGGGASSS